MIIMNGVLVFMSNIKLMMHIIGIIKKIGYTCVYPITYKKIFLYLLLLLRYFYIKHLIQEYFFSYELSAQNLYLAV